MAFFKRSLAEDSTDRVIHTWTVALLLLLSFATFLISVALPSGEGTGSQHNRQVADLDVRCWFPDRFQASNIIYSTSVCKSAVGRALRDGNDTSISRMPPEGYQLSTEQDELWKPKHLMNTKNTTSTDKDAQYPPLVLFIFAILTKLPHLLFQLASMCTALKVDKTLKAAVEAQTKDPADRGQLVGDIARSTSVLVQASPSRASFNYLSYKFISFLTMLALTVYLALVPVSTSHSDNYNYSVKETKISDTVLCRLGIMQMSNTQNYLFQCNVDYTYKPTSAEETEIWVRYTLIGLLVYFAVCTIVSLVSFVTWVAKLNCGLCHDVNGPRSPAAKDAQLLLLLSQENAGPSVTKALRHSWAWGEGGDDPESHVMKPL